MGPPNTFVHKRGRTSAHAGFFFVLSLNDCMNFGGLTIRRVSCGHSRNNAVVRMQDLKYMFIYIYISIYMPITSFDGPLLGFSKARSRERRQNVETWNAPTASVGSSGLLGHFLL